MVVAIGGKPWPGEISGRPAAHDYVRTLSFGHQILPSQELRDRRVEDMTNATSSA